MSVVVAVLLVVVVAAVAIAVVGVLLARDPFDALHHLGPIPLVAGVPLLVAVAIEEGVGIAAGRTAVVIALLLVGGPLVTHALARAGVARGDADLDHLGALDLEVDRS